ncbi:MAG: hypothetical protein CVU79_00810 [Elusimicrobia bacterium HGW-Elusimicrobia-3]|nr:MAG: hypothetical protein CVU79_00810 [Elusimicrobia bacterium HGW-Elusimicrobia-3]
MKKCPACGYVNPAGTAYCAICRRDLSAVAPLPELARPKEPSLLPASAMVLLGCAVLFYALQNFAWQPAAAPDSAVDEPPDYPAIAVSIELAGRQRYLPDEDKLRALPLLSSPDPAVARAAIGAAGAWLRAGADGGTGAALFGALLGAAEAGTAGARRLAATEAGYALAAGFPLGAQAARLGRAAAALAAEGDAELRYAGYFLAAMAGDRSYERALLDALKYDPVRRYKLYAACALSRLGAAEGNAHLAGAISGADPEEKLEAIACLTYSAAPEAESLLASASLDLFSPGSAESAKRALMLRKQLAIIKK